MPLVTLHYFFSSRQDAGFWLLPFYLEKLISGAIKNYRKGKSWPTETCSLHDIFLLLLTAKCSSHDGINQEVEQICHAQTLEDSLERFTH